jgi:hypothetical protein
LNGIKIFIKLICKMMGKQTSEKSGKKVTHLNF